MNKKVKFSGLWTAILSVVSVAYIFPILLVLINSFKKKHTSVVILLQSQRIKCS